MVTHLTYRAGDGSWLSPDEVTRDGDDFVHVESGHPVTPGRVEKMSKSKRNTIDPEPILARYGADAARWFVLSDSPPERDLEWSEGGIEGAARFVQRVYRLALGAVSDPGDDPALLRKVHKTIAGVDEAIEELQFNKAIALLYEFTSAIEKAGPSATKLEAVRTLVQLIAPMAPHLAEECWDLLGERGLVVDSAWPKADPALLMADEVTLVLQVNGKIRDKVVVPANIAEADARALALANDKVLAATGGAEPRKVIYVAKRLVNIVA
jgi:leucyl-tRNA synthetase